MRMWMINPRYMCNQHLLGEHVELHMLAGVLRKGHSVKGYLKGLLDPKRAEARHSRLVQEMESRGMKHASPLSLKTKIRGPINLVKNIIELASRCKKCRARMQREVGSR